MLSCDKSYHLTANVSQDSTQATESNRIKQFPAVFKKIVIRFQNCGKITIRNHILSYKTFASNFVQLVGHACKFNESLKIRAFFSLKLKYVRFKVSKLHFLCEINNCAGISY